MVSDCNRRGYSRIPPLIGLERLKEFFLCVLDAVRENSLLLFLIFIFLGLLIVGYSLGLTGYFFHSFHQKVSVVTVVSSRQLF